MNRTFEVLEQIAAQSGSNAKLALLATLKDNEFAKFYFETVFNPYLTYGVVPGVFPTEKQVTPPPLEILKAIRNSLSTRKVTGSAARFLMAKTYNTTDPMANKWLQLMWAKNIRIGIAQSAIDKIYPGLVPEYTIQKCEKWTKEILDANWVMSRKLNGFRMSIEFDGNNITAQSSNGRELFNVQHIVDELKPYVKNAVVDGELMSNKSLEHSWNATASLARSSKTKKDGTLQSFNVFYIIPLDEWRAKQCTKTMRETIDIINTTIPDGLKYVTKLENYPIENTDQAWALARQFLEEGYEGGVAKDLNSVYQFDRCTNWLKFKFENELDLKIVGTYEGTGKNVGRLGGFVLELPNKSTVHCGGGFKDWQRVDYWAKRNELTGVMVEVKFQELTKDGSLLFPIFKRLREDKTA